MYIREKFKQIYKNETGKNLSMKNVKKPIRAYISCSDAQTIVYVTINIL